MSSLSANRLYPIGGLSKGLLMKEDKRQGEKGRTGGEMKVRGESQFGLHPLATSTSNTPVRISSKKNACCTVLAASLLY